MGRPDCQDKLLDFVDKVGNVNQATTRLLAQLLLTRTEPFTPISFPAPQLTRYDLDAPWQIHRGILKLAPNLVEARITTLFDDEPWPELGEIIELPCLRRLYVSHSDSLQFLLFPVLEEIAIFWDEFDAGRDDGLSRLESSLIRSSCPVRRLCLEGCPETGLSMDILNKFPSIVELAIIINSADASKEGGTLMNNLIASSVSSRIVAPQLCCLYFGCINDGSIDHELYLAMVKTRWEADRCALKSAALLIDSRSRPSDALLSKLKDLREDGLGLVLLNGKAASIAMDDWLHFSLWN
ncbi:hypothetical protein B0H19DRAFT_1369243 [Mycena capillaripes]|nr:hypothetical protein B0H19DRAFT_1369243 [Mycena capillaripes]